MTDEPQTLGSMLKVIVGAWGSLRWTQRVALTMRAYLVIAGMTAMVVASICGIIVVGVTVYMLALVGVEITLRELFRFGGKAARDTGVWAALLVSIPVWWLLVRFIRRDVRNWEARGQRWLLRFLQVAVHRASSVAGAQGGGATSMAALRFHVPVDEINVPDIPAPSRQRSAGRLVLYPILGCVLVVFVATSVKNFIHFGCRSKGSEARQMLQQVYRAQASFHGEHGRYATLEELTASASLAPPGVKGRYYEVNMEVVGDAYIATAVDSVRPIANSEHRRDRWRQTPASARPTHEWDGCTNTVP